MSPDTTNPYDPPQTDSLQRRKPRNTFMAWERLRPRYNLVAAACIVFATGPGLPRLLSDTRFWQSSLLVLCAANVIYTVGHVLEHALSNRTEPRWLRGMLFGGLCLVALGIAIASVAAEMYPGI